MANSSAAPAPPSAPPQPRRERVVIVMPAYNAAKTLEDTFRAIPAGYFDEVVVVDDHSGDETAELARRLNLKAIRHPHNVGYGGNQKTCYMEALRRGADVIVMLHPDYQYSPRLLPAMAAMIASGHFDVALGSRVLGEGALAGGMPIWKYAANRVLTAVENVLLRYKLSEYHTGYRAFSRRVLETLPLEENDDDFVFDNQILAQAIWFGFHIGEISCPARYFAEASSIGFHRSVKYGLGVLGTALEYRAARLGLRKSPRFSETGRKLGEVGAPQLPPG